MVKGLYTPLSGFGGLIYFGLLFTDAMQQRLMRVLKDPERRLILEELDAACGEIDASNPSIKEHHTHYPMMEQAGVIERSKDGDRIREGPNFKHAMRLLTKYTIARHQSQTP